MNIIEEIEKSIKAAIPDAEVQASGGGGHFNIRVVSEEFRGKNIVQKQRLVYNAIWDLMKGNSAPLHAVDSMECLLPEDG